MIFFIIAILLGLIVMAHMLVQWRRDGWHSTTVVPVRTLRWYMLAYVVVFLLCISGEVVRS